MFIVICAQGNVCWLLKSPLGREARCVGTTSHPVPGAPIFEALRGRLAARDMLGQRSQTPGFDFGVALGELRAWTGCCRLWPCCVCATSQPLAPHSCTRRPRRPSGGRPRCRPRPCGPVTMATPGPSYPVTQRRYAAPRALIGCI